MLVNLDNEVHFKKVFTDVEVFTSFVKDVTGVTMKIKKVETEKVLENKVSAIKFRMDLFAEDEEQRTVVEIQKVDYDYTYDRFSHYFMANLIDMQRDSKDYSYAKDVYVIVVVTAAYRIKDKTGEFVKEGIMMTDLNPRNLNNEVIYMHDHKMVIINTVHADASTPKEIKDWIDLIAESMKTNQDTKKINTSKKAIAKAVKLANLNKVSPQQLADAKIHEMRKKTLALVEDMAREKALKEGRIKERDKRIQKILTRGNSTKAEIAEDFEVSIEYVEKIEKEMKEEKNPK